MSTFEVLACRAVIANERVRHGDDLSGIRWIRQDLLISGNARGKDDFPCCTFDVQCAERASVEDDAIFQYQPCALSLSRLCDHRSVSLAQSLVISTNLRKSRAQSAF